MPHETIFNRILDMNHNKVHFLRRVKRAQFNQHTSHFNDLLYKSALAGQSIYGKCHRHDAVIFEDADNANVRIIECFFIYYIGDTRYSRTFVLLRILQETDADSGNGAVVDEYGNMRYRDLASVEDHVHT